MTSRKLFFCLPSPLLAEEDENLRKIFAFNVFPFIENVYEYITSQFMIFSSSFMQCVPLVIRSVLFFNLFSQKIKVSPISCNSRVLGMNSSIGWLEPNFQMASSKTKAVKDLLKASQKVEDSVSKLPHPEVPDRGICFPNNNNSACEKFVCSKAKTINDSAHSFIWHKWHTQMNNTKAENKPELLVVEIYRVFTCARPCLRLAINISIAFRVTQCRQRLCSLTILQMWIENLFSLSCVIKNTFCNHTCKPGRLEIHYCRARHWIFNLPNLRHLLGRARRRMERETISIIASRYLMRN